MKFVDVIHTLGVHPKMNSHCVKKLWPYIHNKMKYLIFYVDFIVTNEYGEQITIPPFTL
jgi:hypothetical protein